MGSSCYQFSNLDENLTVSEIILRATVLGVIIDFIKISKIEDLVADFITNYKCTTQDIIDVQTSSSLFTGNKVDISTL